VLAGVETDEEHGKDDADIERDENQDKVMSKFGGKKALRLSTKYMEFRVFSSWSKP
jgi:hypothetical protein